MQETTQANPPSRRSFEKKGEKREISLVDRLPPHSLEAEKGVLGCALLDPNIVLGLCLEKFKSGKSAFYDLRHQHLYELMTTMYDAKQPIDLITLHQRLKDQGQLEAVGGLPYIVELQDSVPSAANIEYYLDIVREKHLLRRMVRTCTEVITDVYDYEGQVDALLDDVERKVLQINEERVEATSMGMKELVHKAINTIEEFHARQGALTGLSTGFPDLDKMTSGFHGGEMVVLAARPSMGKTSLAMNWAEHAALEMGVPVGVFSLEMTSESLVLRMLCSRSRVNLRSIRDGFLAERDFPKLTTAAGKLANAPLHIDDTPGLSILALRAKARRMHQQHGIKMFVIDYLQLLHSTSRKADQNRQQEIADISNGLKSLAKELDVPVVVLSQLNREMEKDKNRKPRLSDLRESGSIEQDADLVCLLYKPNTGDEDIESVPRDEPGGVGVSLLIAKQRNGPTGDVPMTFLKGITRFESASKVSDGDIPADSYKE